MASIILSSAATSVGNALVPGLGGKLLGALARKVGHAIDQEIGWTSRQAAKDGARLENLKVQDSRYGVAIPVVFGAMRVAGNVIWASDLIETAHESGSSGGKGGVVGDALGGGSSRTTYTYAVNCAIAIAAGEIGGVQTIWADSKPIFQNGAWADGIVASANLHLGLVEQGVDPLLEGWTGAGLCPAYRGIAYIVLEGFELKRFGNRLPNLTFEVLPADTLPAPLFLGSSDPATKHNMVANRQGAMPPLVIEGGASGARAMLVGGYACDGVDAFFEAIEYDVTTSAPQETARTQTALFPCEDVAAHVWALSPDGRMVALGSQDSAAGYPFRARLYDAQTRRFGDAISIGMTAAEDRQIAWLDAYRLVVMDQRDGRRGARVLLRSGLELIDLGFFDVWGEGSAAARVPVYYTQFKTLGGGVMMMMGDRAPNLTALYARHLTWNGGSLAVGDEIALAVGLDVGTGSGMQARIESIGGDEWVFMCLTAVDMRMMSFAIAPDGCSVTRPWQTIVSAQMGVASCHAPMATGGALSILHRPSLENLYRLSTIVCGDGSFSLEKDAVAVDGVDVAASAIGAVVVDAARFLVLGNAGADGTLASAGLFKRRSMSASLDAIVGAILARAGYEEGDYNLAALADRTVDGYAVSERASAADALAPLQLIEPFDLVESDGQLVAVLPDAATSASVPDADLCVPQGGACAIVRERAQELDLPLEVIVDHHDASRDYEAGSQRARRGGGVTQARSVASVEAPVVCAPAQAKAAAETLLFTAWTERERFRFFLSRAWLALAAGDIVNVAGARVRIERIAQREGLLQIDAVAALPEGFARAGQAEGGSGASAAPVLSQPCELHIMDMPLLRAEDDQAGVYVAIGGPQGVRGASLWRSADGEEEAFARIATTETIAVTGALTSSCAAAGAHIVDRVSVLRVQLARGSLSGCTPAQMMNGANVARVGAEILQFQNAALVEEGVYDLSILLRGRRGTDVAAHQAGEAFVLLQESTTRFLPAAQGERGATFHFRAVADGGSLALAQDVAFAYGFATLAPHAPAHLRGTRPEGAGGDLVLSWIRCARKNAAWVDYIDVPLDEDEERYSVEVMNGSAVARSFDVVGARTATYTAAMQNADWSGAPPPSVVIRVAQISARFGRGAYVQETV